MRSGAAAKRSLLGPARAGVGMVLALAACSAFAKPDLTGVQLPPGFKIEVLTDQVPLAREIAFGDKGTIFVGSMRFGAAPADKVYYIRTVNGKPVVKTLLSGLNNPNGVAFRNGSLYVGEVNQITRYDD